MKRITRAVLTAASRGARRTAGFLSGPAEFKSAPEGEVQRDLSQVVGVGPHDKSNNDAHHGRRPRDGGLSGGTLLMVVAGFAVLTIVLTYPQARYLTSGVGIHFDSLFNVWRLAWVAHQLPRDPLHLFDANIFFPERATLAYSDAMLLPGVALAPLAWLGMSPITIYNLVLLASFVSSATAAAILGWRLTRRVEAGVIAGMIFGFAPHRFEHFTHLELQLNWWMPLAFLALQDALTTARARSYAALAVLLSLQVLSCIYHGLFLVVCLIGAAAAVMIMRQAASLGRHVPGVAWLAMAVAVFFLYSLPYRGNRQVVGERPLWEIADYSAVPANFLAAHPDNVLYGAVTSRFGHAELYLFPGVIAAALAAIGVFSHRRSVVAVWLVTLWFAIELCLGMNGWLYPVLYDHLEVFHGLRVPGRAGILVILSLAALAALGVELALTRLRGRGGRIALVTVLVVGMAAESRSRVLVTEIGQPSTGYRLLQRLPAAVVLELPVEVPERLSPWPETLYMYYSTAHWKKLINGYSGFYPPIYGRTLESLRSFPDRSSLARLERLGVTHVILHREGWFGPMKYEATVSALLDLGVPLIIYLKDIAIFSLPKKAAD